MIQIKKTILSLVALLAVTTGAWAEETPLLTIESKGNRTFGNGSKTFGGMVTVTFSNSVQNDGDEWGWYTNAASLLTVAGTNGYTITSCKFYTLNGSAANGITVKGESPSVYLNNTNVYTDDSKSENIGRFGISKIEVYGGVASAASGPEVAWDKAKKTGTFTMPGGNVTLEPEYYDLATLADNGLTAAEDAAAKTEAPLAVLAENAVTGGTLMYFVIYDENFSQADAIALAEDEWEAAIPTAETIEAAGTYYVWYYIKGDDEHSDTDPQRLAVTVLPEPTYAVEFAEGVNPEPPAEPKWTASPAAGVKKGETVTVTYTGQRKVMGVKAEKKAAAPSLNITNPEVGQVIGSDGKNYAYGSLPTGVTAVAKICYVSGSNGLALALTDEGYMDWSTAKTTCAAHTPAFTGGTWKLASNDEWDNMISAAGSYSALRDGFSSVGGTNMLSAGYWSSTESNAEGASFYFFDYGYWSEAYKDSEGNAVRACLAF